MGSVLYQATPVRWNLQEHEEWVSCHGKPLICYCKRSKRSASSLDLVQNAEKALQTEGRRHILGDAAPCSTTCGMDLCLAR